MQPGLDAYWNLVALALADGEVSADERRLLERYREALDVSTNQAERIERELGSKPPTFKIIGEAGERAHVLKLMLRVALADGKLSSRERARLERVASAMRVGPAQFAELRVSAENDHRHERRSIRNRRLGMAAVAAAVVAAVAVWARDETPAPAPPAPIPVAERSEDLERVRETQLALERAERELAARVAELESRETVPAELERVRTELVEVRWRGQAFKDIQKRYDASVLLILVQFTLVKGDDRRTFQGSGTGFWITPTGLVATNKHVVMPWLYQPPYARLRESGYVYDPKSLFMAAWPAGSTVMGDGDTFEMKGSYNTTRHTLRLAAAGPDAFERREATDAGATFEADFHAQNNDDLAILEATIDAPVRAIPLNVDASTLDKLDPVMVLGFPSGFGILESRRAETSPSLGEVRKIEDTIFVTAPLVPGNSGGPLLDAAGTVVGVATRTAGGEATLGACIPARHLLALLPSEHDLRDAAAGLEGDAAAAMRRLADQKK